MKSAEKVVAIKPVVTVSVKEPVVEKKVVAVVKEEKEKDKTTKIQNSTVSGGGNMFAGKGGNMFTRPNREVKSSAPGEPAKFTSDHQNWRGRPPLANEQPKVLSKTGEPITEKEFKLLSGQVAINGYLLEPVIKDMTYLHMQSINANELGIHLPQDVYPHSVYSVASAPGPFNVYQFELNNENVVIFLDADSSFWFDGNSHYYHNINHNQFTTARYSEEVVLKGGAVVVLENSHLKNCGVIGTVVILNGDFRDFALNNSRYTHSKEINPRFRFNTTLPENPEAVTKHPEYRGGALINSRVSNSKLANAYYQNAHITDSTLDFGESHYSSVVRAQINTSTIKSKSQVLLIDASFNDSAFNGNSLAVAGFSLDAVNLYLDNVFAPTKVCISKFDAVDSNYSGYNLVRQGAATMNLYRHSSGNGNLIIKLADDDESIRTAIKAWLNDAGGDGRWNDVAISKEGPINKSITRYTVDTIMARLNSIRLLDEVQALSRNTGNSSGYSLLDMVSY